MAAPIRAKKVRVLPALFGPLGSRNLQVVVSQSFRFAQFIGFSNADVFGVGQNDPTHSTKNVGFVACRHCFLQNDAGGGHRWYLFFPAQRVVSLFEADEAGFASEKGGSVRRVVGHATQKMVSSQDTTRASARVERLGARHQRKFSTVQDFGGG